MPEGPSIIILKELIADLALEGHQVVDVVGTTTIDQKRMLNQKIKYFKTWGKHFLICFEHFALRIHLMMYGTYRLNERKKGEPKIGLIFEHAELNFYTCELKYIEGDLTETYDWSADIMSEEYQTASTVKKLQVKKDSVLCDLLLDQAIFAGAGNIIKNEVLYRTKLHPLTVVRELTPKKLADLANEVRQYAFDFLRWKKEYTLKKHWQIYGQKKCPKSHAVSKENLGQNKRVTYYCKECQQPKKRK